jgi:hypothetical protein
MESIISSKQRRRRPFGEDAIDSIQGAALTPMEKFSWAQLYLDDMAKILANFSHGLFTFQHLACFLLALFSYMFVVLRNSFVVFL